MPKEVQDAEHGDQAHKYFNNESVEDILATVDQFIEGVYRDLSLTSTNSGTSRNSPGSKTNRCLDDGSSTNEFQVGATSSSNMSSGDDCKNLVSPPKRKNMDAEIERINRMCVAIDNNLRSIGVFINNSGNSSSSLEENLSTNITSPIASSTNSMADLSIYSTPQRTTATSSNSENLRLEVTANPVTIIDLSETQSQASLVLDNTSNNSLYGEEDDDVILVSANIDPVVDLCTPGGKRRTSGRRRRAEDYPNLNRRSLPVPDVQIVDTSDLGDVVQKRHRITNKRKSLNTSSDVTIIQNNNNNNNSLTASKTTSGPIPYMCSVCMESCLPREPTSTKCGHIFCNACIRQAIKITRKCPMCNTRISSNHLFRIYP